MLGRLARGGAKMSVVGRVESAWRYPVKSMRGENCRKSLPVLPESMGTGCSPLRARPRRPAFPT
jgi:hypothetical protein